MHDLQGMDYEWYCSDAEGNIAVMITAGEAPIPSSVLHNLALNDKMKSFAWTLPEKGGYSLDARDVFISEDNGAMSTFLKVGDVPAADTEINQRWLRDFIALAKRGFFSYDWADVHRPISARSNKYELMAAPLDSLKVADLPQEFRSLVLSRALPGVRFRDSRCIDITSCLECK